MAAADALPRSAGTADPGRRRSPRSRRTIVGNMNSIRTSLTDAGGRYSTLRQVTRNIVARWVASPPGRSRPATTAPAQPIGHLESRTADLRRPRPPRARGRAQPVGAGPLPAHQVTAIAETATGSPHCGTLSRWPASTPPQRAATPQKSYRAPSRKSCRQAVPLAMNAYSILLGGRRQPCDRRNAP